MSASRNCRARGAFGAEETPSARRRVLPVTDERPSGALKAGGRDPSERQSAMAFLEGRSWDLHELVTWSDAHMVRPGRLLTQHAFPRILIREHGKGVLSYGTPTVGEVTAGFLPHSEARSLVAQARLAVVSKLEGLLRAAPDDSFVQAAIYDGRVTRGKRRDGTRGWQVLVTEQHALSDQVLALLVADLLDHRQDYDHDLVVCDTCSKVTFWPERMSRRGCSEHPDARLTLRSMRTGSLSR